MRPLLSIGRFPYVAPAALALVLCLPTLVERWHPSPLSRPHSFCPRDGEDLSGTPHCRSIPDPHSSQHTAGPEAPSAVPTEVSGMDWVEVPEGNLGLA